MRYSGSLIPLDFAECADDKGVWCVELDGAGSGARAEWVASPVTRRLKQLSGSGDALAAALEAFGERHADDRLRPWVEVQLDREYADQKARAGLRQLAERVGVEILKFTRARAGGLERAPNAEGEALERLDELSVEEVFARRLVASELTPPTQSRVTELFGTALAAARAGQPAEAYP